MPSLSWLVKLYENLTYVRMQPAAIRLNYSVKDIRSDVCQIIYTSPKKFSEGKQVHVGMEASKPNQTGWE